MRLRLLFNAVFWSIRKLLISFIQHWLFFNDLQAQIRIKWVKFWCGFWTPYLPGWDCLSTDNLTWADIQRNLEEVTKISERHYRNPFSLCLGGRKIVKLWCLTIQGKPMAYILKNLHSFLAQHRQFLLKKINDNAIKRIIDSMTITIIMLVRPLF